MVGIKDIAKAVGVSSASISLYLKDPDTTRVGSETKQKIDKAVKELNYRPNSFARSLSSKKTQTIGILLPFQGSYFRSTFVNEVLTGIQSVLFPNGYSMVFMPAAGTGSTEMVKKQIFTSNGHDGYILFGTRYCTADDMEANARELLTLEVPFTVINMPEFKLPINQVLTTDNISMHPVKYLLDQGHREIILMVGREGNTETYETIELYKELLKQFGIPFVPENILYGDFERDIARGAMDQFLQRKKAFTAIFCMTDSMALGVYESFKAADIRIPEDVSVIGKNDSFFATLMDPPLTTLKRESFAEGEKAANLLLSTLHTGRSGHKVSVQTQLVIRGSVKPYLGVKQQASTWAEVGKPFQI